MAITGWSTSFLKKWTSNRENTPNGWIILIVMILEESLVTSLLSKSTIGTLLANIIDRWTFISITKWSRRSTSFANSNSLDQKFYNSKRKTLYSYNLPSMFRTVLILNSDIIHYFALYVSVYFYLHNILYNKLTMAKWRTLPTRIM